MLAVAVGRPRTIRQSKTNKIHYWYVKSSYLKHYRTQENSSEEDGGTPEPFNPGAALSASVALGIEWPVTLTRN
jgi:hypothetical protein